MAKACKLLSMEGVKQNKIARLFRVNRSTLCRIVSHYQSTSDFENWPRRWQSTS